MEERIRKLLREYTAEPTDALAHKIVTESLRSREITPLNVDAQGVPDTLVCPGCMHPAYEDVEQREVINEEVGIYRLYMVCECDMASDCDCRTAQFIVEYSTEICMWCQQAPAVRISGPSYAIGSGAPLCRVCDPS